jgi:hypothetical protein
MNLKQARLIREIREHEAAGARPAVDYLEELMSENEERWEQQWLRAERLELALLNAAASIDRLQAQLDELRAAVEGALVTTQEKAQQNG